jgi:hypothetical protein
MQKQEFIDSLKSNKLTVFLSEEGFGNLKPCLYSILKDEVFKLDCDRHKQCRSFYAQFFASEIADVDSERTELISLIGKDQFIAENLLGLIVYLGKIKEFPYLLIEYPEQNLHPIKQRKLARLLARLITRGVKLIVLTHSSNIVREFNNLIMLNNQSDKQQFFEKYGYIDDDCLDSKYIKAYEIINNKIVEAEIINEGIIASVLDGAIETANTICDDLYCSLDSEDEEE